MLKNVLIFGAGMLAGSAVILNSISTKGMVVTNNEDGTVTITHVSSGKTYTSKV